MTRKRHEEEEQAETPAPRKKAARKSVMSANPQTDPAIEADPATAKNLAEALEEEQERGSAESERSTAGERETQAMKRAKGMGGPGSVPVIAENEEAVASRRAKRKDDGARVRLTRVRPLRNGSPDDNFVQVHPDEVQDWIDAGWRLESTARR
jgi:hypothetical protein